MLNSSSTLVCGVQALYRRGQAWAGAGDYERAKADLIDAIRLDPNNADLRTELDKVKKEEQVYLKKQNEMFSKMGSAFSSDD